jgi:hypothetical protein
VSTTLSTSVDTTTHPPHELDTKSTSAARHRVRFTHRVALHLGLALITWSRRPSTATPSHAHVALRDAREQQAERLLRLNTPVR